MEGKLKKINDTWYKLFGTDGSVKASTKKTPFGKLSLKNCQTIENSYDLDEFDVEVEMICPHPEDTYRCGIEYGCDADGCNHPNKVPYTDKDGCLILKRK